MPVPVIVGVVGLATRIGALLASRWSWLSLGTVVGMAPDLWGAVKAWIVAEAARLAGLQLDPDDPLSDASLAGAVTQKTGIPLRSLRDRDTVMEDIDDYAASRASEKLGFTISTFRNTTQARADFEAAALQVISLKTGIPFAPGPEGFTVESIKSQVLDWARPQLAIELSGNAGMALQVLGGEGVDFEALAAEMNGKLQAIGSGETITAGRIAVHVAESMVKTSAQALQVTAAGLSKKSRRALQVRAAQQKFRAAHGNRQQYVPLGMTGTIS